MGSFFLIVLFIILFVMLVVFAIFGRILFSLFRLFGFRGRRSSSFYSQQGGGQSPFPSYGGSNGEDSSSSDGTVGRSAEGQKRLERLKQTAEDVPFEEEK